MCVLTYSVSYCFRSGMSLAADNSFHVLVTEQLHPPGFHIKTRAKLTGGMVLTSA